MAAEADGQERDRPEPLVASLMHRSETPDTEHARPRKRTRRACDKCSASRTRCDGECPCRRCEDYGYTCRYNREVKKRGRLPASATANNHNSNGSSINARRDSWPQSHRRGSIRNDSNLGRSSNGNSNSNSNSNGISQASCSSPSASISSSTVGQHPFADTVDATSAGPESVTLDQRDQVTVPDARQDMLHSISQPYSQSRTAPPLSVPSLVQVGLQPPPPQRSSIGNSLSVSVFDGQFADSEVVLSDESAGYPSPVNGRPPIETGSARQHRGSFKSTPSHERNRESFSTAATGHDAAGLMLDFFHKAPNEDCWYKFLEPILPYIRNIIPASVACDLLDIFLTDPGSSLFRVASPYILTRVFRKKSIVHPTNPRYTTPALLATILWCVAQTADVMMLHVPGSRAKVVNDLYDLATSLISERDPDRWRRIHGGLRAENETPHPRLPNAPTVPKTTVNNEPAGETDDVLTFILLSIAVSGSDFKSDCYKWWSKATRLAFSLGLHREDEQCAGPVTPCANPLCSCKKDQDGSIYNLELREERRRVFWLLYALDRHLALSFNSALTIPDSYCEVYSPLPEAVWENLDTIPPSEIPARRIGPPTTASGSAFFEYFLPLMAILGDIIEVHHRRRHPRLAGLDDSHSVAVIQELLSTYELSLAALSPESNDSSTMPLPIHTPKGMVAGMPPRPSISHQHPPSAAPYNASDPSKMRLAKAYSAHILHVLHVLLHGKWDAISMLDDGDDWITSKRFNECASHAISASQSVSTILTIDPELTFMSYLFGIYLLQGSFILLLFADRMPQLGPNESVAQACENIIRAHEVCVVTLSTEFQKNFRTVLRSTLYSVQGAGTTNWDEHRSRRRALSLYRWTKGAKGLAL
ncbi:Xylanolytic transcriptional activator xlnR [Trichoderma lentiforme]|uniref:Xylanolytic transcriptional activator xlnR n=1 Tax=Trichoderma lentiforme TaxID=1567552 RepID=A0A9P5C923_9HYPO|nr:Xylanolytic transcriptional activator xlnR [Trichoderma lentiforme]